MGRESKPVSVEQIGKYLEDIGVSVEIQGNLKRTVLGFSSLSNYLEGTITWIGSAKKKEELPHEISVCVVQEGVEVEAETKIISSNSKTIFFSILDKFWGRNDKELWSVGEGSVIGENVHIGNNVHIGCNCSIKGEIWIGSGTVIGDNVVIKNKVKIGCDCVIQSLSVIGEDGYGYFEDEFHVKTMIKHFGGVVIEDNVFIGSHTNVARGTLDDTVIKEGVKVAPSTHIGHNNYVGKNAALICSHLFGSVKIGENAYVSSSVIRNQSRVGDNAIIGMGSVVTKDIEKNKVVIGSPARVIRENSGKEKL